MGRYRHRLVCTGENWSDGSEEFLHFPDLQSVLGGEE